MPVNSWIGAQLGFQPSPSFPEGHKCMAPVALSVRDFRALCVYTGLVVTETKLKQKHILISLSFV